MRGSEASLDVREYGAAQRLTEKLARRITASRASSASRIVRGTSTRTDGGLAIRPASRRESRTSFI